MTERESYQCIQISEGCQEGPDFSAMSSDRIRDDGHKLEHRKLHLNMKKNFTLGVTDHWNTPRVVAAPFPGNTQNPPGHILCNLL